MDQVTSHFPKRNFEFVYSSLTIPQDSSAYPKVEELSFLVKEWVSETLVCHAFGYAFGPHAKGF